MACRSPQRLLLPVLRQGISILIVGQSNNNNNNNNNNTRTHSSLKYMISWIIHAFWLVLAYDLSEDRCIDDVTINNILLLHGIKHIDSMLSGVCLIKARIRRQNVIKTSVTHSAASHLPDFCSYHILMSFGIYYWTEIRQRGIFLLSNIWTISPAMIQ